MPDPTLGCQIAPHYDRDQWPYNSETDTTDTDTDAETPAQEVVEDALPIEKAVTQCSRGITPAISNITTRRSRRRSNAPQAPVGFWHWQMAGVRLHVLKLWLRTNLILALAVMALLCLFWGALFRQNDNVKHLQILVVDFDGQAPYTDTASFVGPFVTAAVSNMTAAGGIVPTYTLKPPSDFHNDPLKVRQAVYDMHAWAAVIINANATTLLTSAIHHGNASYDPAGACQLIFNTARDQTVASSYIITSLTILQNRITSTFGTAWILHLAPSLSSLPLTTAPHALSPGISFTLIDLRPFGPPVATPAVTIGLIYLIIISFFSFTFFLPIHMKYLSPRGHPPLLFHHLIAWRYTATVTSYLLLSLVYSCVSAAFLLPLSNPPASPVESARNPNAYGRATFPVYWMSNWLAMTAFGLASENAAMLLGTPWTALWLIFWVISNVSTGFYSLDLAPAFYRWGIVWPLHNIAELTHTTLFDLSPAHVARNFAILAAWVVVDTLLFPLCCYFMRWNTARVKRGAEKAEREWCERMERERTEPGFWGRVGSRGGEHG